jgi:hypothetical protein
MPSIWDEITQTFSLALHIPRLKNCLTEKSMVLMKQCMYTQVLHVKWEFVLLCIMH